MRRLPCRRRSTRPAASYGTTGTEGDPTRAREARRKRGKPRPMISNLTVNRKGLDHRRFRVPLGASSCHERAVARVAVAALPIDGDILTEILEDVARPALRALTVVDHRAKLGAVLLAPLLVVGEVGAQVD